MTNMALPEAIQRSSKGDPAPDDSAQIQQSQQCMAAASQDNAANFSPDRPAGSTTQSCPYQQNKTKPCDVERLTLLDQTSGKTVTTNTPVSRRKLAPKAPDAPDRIDILRPAHDLVLEVTADFPTEEPKSEKDQKPAKLLITAEYLGQCPLSQHSLITLTPQCDALPEEGPHTWQLQSPGPISILAKSGMGDKGGGPSKWLAPFWFFSDDVKEFSIVALSCGVRPGGLPKVTLNGLLRVFRNDVFTLSCTIPPFKTWNKSKSSYTGSDGTKDKTTSSSSKTFGEKASEASQTHSINKAKDTDTTETVVGSTNGQGYTRLSSTEGKKDGQEYLSDSEEYTERNGISGITSRGDKVTQSDSTTDGEKLVFDLEPSELQPSVSLKRNNKEVNFTKFINDLLNLHQRISKAWNDIQNWVPKIGWSATFELSLLQGTISGEWGTKPTEKWKEEAYSWVYRYYSVNFSVKVLSYTMGISFGVDFSIPSLLDWFGDAKLFEIILQAELTLKGDASVSEVLSSSEPSKTAPITGSATLEGDIHGRVSVMGYTYDAKAGVIGGIKFEGQLVGSWQLCPHISGKAYFVETNIYATFIDGVTGDHSDEYKRIIFEQHDIWSGNMPETC